MDCRTAHALMQNERDEAQLDAVLAQHFAECAACRDDAADPVGRLLAHVSGEFLSPSMNFTQQVIARLPQAAPQQLAQQADLRRRWMFGLGLAPVALVLLTLILGPFFQNVWAGSTLDIVAQTLWQIAGAIRWSLVLMLISAAAILALVVRLLRIPTTRSAVGAILAAMTLLLASTIAGYVNDRDNARAARTTSASVATVVHALETTQPIRGSVASLFGDVAVGKPVQGTVASLFGNVTLSAGTPVIGNVLVGAGHFTGDPKLITEGVINNIDQLVLASSVPGISRVTWSPQRGRAVIALVGVVILLALLGLTAALWPDPLARASVILAAQLWPALGLGTLLISLWILLLGPMLALLAWSVVGLLALPLLGLALHLPLIFGLSVVGGMIAQRLFKRATLPASMLANGVMILALLALAMLLPLAGAASFYLLASVGFGALLLSVRGTVVQ